MVLLDLFEIGRDPFGLLRRETSLLEPVAEAPEVDSGFLFEVADGLGDGQYRVMSLSKLSSEMGSPSVAYSLAGILEGSSLLRPLQKVQELLAIPGQAEEGRDRLAFPVHDRVQREGDRPELARPRPA